MVKQIALFLVLYFATFVLSDSSITECAEYLCPTFTDTLSMYLEKGCDLNFDEFILLECKSGYTNCPYELIKEMYN